MQEESSVVTFDSHVINGEGNSDRSLSDVKTVMKGEFCVDESLTHTTIVQKQKQEAETIYELQSISTVQNSLDSTLSNVSVVIKEELTLEDTDEEHLVDKVLYNITADSVILM